MFSGEVSYVLIVQPNQKKEDGEAEAVYDFDTEDPGFYDNNLQL